MRKPVPRGALIVHGGAGSVCPARERAPRKAAMLEAVEAGATILRAGGSALDAVMASVVVLENHPLFNAGYGSTLNADGEVEMDASVMVADSRGSRAGAVAAVAGIRNPVQLARAVMEHTPHVLMAGQGAERLAHRYGIEVCDPQELISPRARERYLDRIKREKEAAEEKHGTVGAAAVDVYGKLSAATSTGGVPGKLPGRVGDSAIIGAGTFANEVAAASATGHGEAIIHASLCRETVEAIERSTLTSIARRKIAQLIAPQGFEAGIVLVDCRARIGYAHNADAMDIGIFDIRGGIRFEEAAPMQHRSGK
jgi:L-asparaginase / beta-aspartyl-peptidase